MRPYRGLTKDGKWVYGWYFTDLEKHYIIDPEQQDISKLDMLTLPDGYIFAVHEVIPETVSEQIGLPDKNGVEAYENDEIKFLTISGGIGKGVIEYEAPIYFVRTKTGARYEFSEFSDFEVIGSIHQEVKI